MRFCVDRRTGGLEKPLKEYEQAQIVDRRTGGLEMPRFFDSATLRVDRRTGGLERQGTHFFFGA